MCMLGYQPEMCISSFLQIFSCFKWCTVISWVDLCLPVLTWQYCFVKLVTCILKYGSLKYSHRLSFSQLLTTGSVHACRCRRLHIDRPIYLVDRCTYSGLADSTRRGGADVGASLANRTPHQPCCYPPGSIPSHCRRPIVSGSQQPWTHEQTKDQQNHTTAVHRSHGASPTLKQTSKRLNHGSRVCGLFAVLCCHHLQHTPSASLYILHYA
jgi:hypothetical protein